MRAIMTMPLAATILLAACGGGDDEAAEGEALTGDEVAAAAEGMVQPRPGEYRTSLELLEFNAPGIPEAAKQQMQQVFASGLAEGNTFCMTEADAAANGPEEMVKNLAESDCEMTTFDVSGNTVSAVMQCAGEDGAASSVRMNGEMTAESSTMTMDMQQQIAGMGDVQMKMRVNSERIGECS